MHATPPLDDVRTAVALASTAPSVHNSQPWRFTWDGTHLDVREERSRAVPVLDPTGRERLLSIGAAVRTARLGFAELGWATTTTLLPDGEQGDVLARLVADGRRAVTPEEHELALAAPRRATDRDPYDTRPVPAGVVAAMTAAAEAEGAWLRVVQGADLVALEVLLAHADDAQVADPHYTEELASWRREDDAVGIPSRALPTVPARQRGSSLALRDFDGGRGSGPVDGLPLPEHPTVLALGTEQDTRRDWLVAGQALAAVLLRGTVEGIAAQPLTAVLEVPATRARLDAALAANGHVQMVLRAGYGTAGPATPRLAVDQVLELVAPS